MTAENKAAYAGVTDPGIKFFEGECIPMEEWEARRPRGVTFSFTKEEIAEFADSEPVKSEAVPGTVHACINDRNVRFIEETQEYISIGDYSPISSPEPYPGESKSAKSAEETLAVTVLTELLSRNGYGNGKTFSPNGEISLQANNGTGVKQPDLAEVSSR